MYWLAIIGFISIFLLAAIFYDKYAKYVSGGTDEDIW
jgi:hypothetical protein